MNKCLEIPDGRLVSLAQYREGRLMALLPHAKLNGETMGEWSRRVAEIARTSDDESTLIELSDYYLYGGQEIHQALRENPAATLRVAETALRNLRIFAEDSWNTTAKADYQAWKVKQGELLSKVCETLTIGSAC